MKSKAGIGRWHDVGTQTIYRATERLNATACPPPKTNHDVKFLEGLYRGAGGMFVFYWQVEVGDSAK